MGKFLIGAVAALLVPGGFVGGIIVLAVRLVTERDDNRVIVVRPSSRIMRTPRVMLTVLS